VRERTVLTKEFDQRPPGEKLRASDGRSGESVRSLASLARLAIDSGGRFTERTNDLSRGVTRARRDRTCVYSLGFDATDSEEDRIRDVLLRVHRPGTRVIYPGKFVVRSAEAKRESSIRAAFHGMSPETDRIRAGLYPLRPLPGGKWGGVVAVSFELPLDETTENAVERDFGAVLHYGPRVSHRFDRRVRVTPRETSASRRITFMEPVKVKPGRYILSVVLSAPLTGRDDRARVEVDVPVIPKGSLFIVGPFLGRRAGTNLVLHSGGSAEAGDTVGAQSSFDPLLPPRIDAPQDLVALTRVCRSGSRKRAAGDADAAPPVIHRVLQDAGSGAVLGRLPEVRLALEGAGRVRCQNLLDVLPSSSMASGVYGFRVSIDLHDDTAGPVEELRFTVGTESAASPESLAME
jgi:hypothetical protein